MKKNIKVKVYAVIGAMVLFYSILPIKPSMLATQAAEDSPAFEFSQESESTDSLVTDSSQESELADSLVTDPSQESESADTPVVEPSQEVESTDTPAMEPSSENKSPELPDTESSQDSDSAEPSTAESSQVSDSAEPSAAESAQDSDPADSSVTEPSSEGGSTDAPHAEHSLENSPPDPTDVIEVIIPTSFSITIWPYGEQGQQIYSNDVVIYNQSSFPVDVSITDINITVNHSLPDDYRGEDSIVKDCNVGILLLCMDMEPAKFLLSEGSNENVLNFSLSAKQEDTDFSLLQMQPVDAVNSPDFAVFSLFGDVSEGSQDTWRNGDLTVQVIFEFHRQP